MRSRQPKQLLFAMLGEFLVDQEVMPVRTGVFLDVLDEAGVAAPAARATLDRLVQTGVLSRERRGRELEFTLSDAGRRLLTDATERVRNPQPPGSRGDGWTLVTFSVPEEQRTLRHRLRASLTWEGFAVLRDGLWVAPGALDLDVALAALREELPPGAVLAFHARELDSFPMDDAVHAAWDTSRIRSAHDLFFESWGGANFEAESTSALALRTMLVADWLELLRVDPGLPPEYMGDDWPAERSLALYLQRRGQLQDASDAEFATRITPRVGVTR